MTTPEPQLPPENADTGAPVIKPYCVFMGKPLYNRAAVLQLLGCSLTTLKRYILLGTIKSVSLGEDRINVAFFEQDIRDFLLRREEKKKKKRRKNIYKGAL